MQAAEILETHDVVLGPSLDGGYYLIGFSTEGFRKHRESDVNIFEDISWSTPSVFKETKSKLESGGFRYGCAPTLNDLDTLDDVMNCPEGKSLMAQLGTSPSTFGSNDQGSRKT